MSLELLQPEFSSPTNRAPSFGWVSPTCYISGPERFMNTWEETPWRTHGGRRMREKGSRWLDGNRGRRSWARTSAGNADHSRRGGLTSCDAAPSGDQGRRRGGSVSGDAIRRGGEETHEARRAAWQADPTGKTLIFLTLIFCYRNTQSTDIHGYLENIVVHQAGVLGFAAGFPHVNDTLARSCLISTRGVAPTIT